MKVVVLVAKASDKKDKPYLMFRVNRLCIDAGVTVYGVAAQASLGGLQMVDKIHTGKKISKKIYVEFVRVILLICELLNLRPS